MGDTLTQISEKKETDHVKGSIRAWLHHFSSFLQERNSFLHRLPLPWLILLPAFHLFAAETLVAMEHGEIDEGKH